MKILLFVLLFYFFYQCVYFVFIYHLKQKFLQKNGLLKPQESIALSILSTNNVFLRYIDRFSPKFLIIKLILLCLLFVGGFNNYASIVMGIIFAIIGFFLPDIYLMIIQKGRKNKILLDLFNVVECLKLQLSSGIALKEAMREISDLCVDESFKSAVKEMSLRYELSEYNIEFAVMGLKKDFPYNEIELFTSSLEGQVDNIGGQENFDNLNELLKERYIANIEDNTKVKVFFIVIAVIIILVNLAILGSFPIIVEIMQNFKQIFN